MHSYLGENILGKGPICKFVAVAFQVQACSETLLCSVLLVQMAFIAFAFRWPSSAPLPPLTLSKSVKSRAKSLLAIFTLLSLLFTMYHRPADAPRPHRPGPRILRAGIWTVHFGLDNAGRDSQRRMRDLIKYVAVYTLDIC